LNRWFFWDGRADSAWAQALGPLENPVEHGTTRLSVAHAVAADPAQRAAYEALFGPLPDLADSARFPARGRPVSDPTNPDAVAWAEMSADDQEAINRVFANVGKAVAAYERKLVTGESAFDRWVAGDEAAMGPEAVRGLQLFVTEHAPERGLRGADCFHCHGGMLFTDNGFHDNGLELEEFDLGRMIVTGDEADRGNFKTPSLRNVALRAPYMHDGRFATLEEVVEHYDSGVRRRPNLDANLAKHPAEGLGLSDLEKRELVAFLRTLTDTRLPSPSTASSPPPGHE
jgi:cytochrome c peroxidase